MNMQGGSMITNLGSSPLVRSTLTREPGQKGSPAEPDGSPGLSDRVNITCNPALKAATQKVIDEVYSLHGKGNGAIGLGRVIETFGAKLTAEQEKSVEKRGDIQFTRTSETGGVFSNKGEAVKVPTDAATLKIPPEVSGTYDSVSTAMALHFTPGKNIVASKSFINFDMETLTADQTHIMIDMEGERFDQYILFEPQPPKTA